MRYKEILLLQPIALLSLTLLLSSCGFTPMYCGDKSQTQAICITVKGEGYTAYKFRRELEKQLAIMPRFNNHDYKLNISLTETKSAASYAQDATITRSQIVVTATYELKQDGKHYGRYTNEITTSYPVVATDEFITCNADKAAENRSAISLAEEVARDVNRLLRTQGQNPK
jgi:LPS-assembly lipoprotein